MEEIKARFADSQFDTFSYHQLLKVLPKLFLAFILNFSNSFIKADLLFPTLLEKGFDATNDGTPLANSSACHNFQPCLQEKIVVQSPSAIRKRLNRLINRLITIILERSLIHTIEKNVSFDFLMSMQEEQEILPVDW